jgi:hypothetical protein
MEYFMNIAFDCIEGQRAGGRQLGGGIPQLSRISAVSVPPCRALSQGGGRIRNRAKNMALAYSPLNIHLIRDHHFF